MVLQLRSPDYRLRAPSGFALGRRQADTVSPYAPRKSCSCRGCPRCQGRCPELTAGGKCDGCRGEVNRSTSSRSDDARVYQSKRWKGIRRAKLKLNPWCEEPGCTALAKVVDHVVAIADGGPDFPELDGTRSYCVAHHNAKTMRELRSRQTDRR